MREMAPTTGTSVVSQDGSGNQSTGALIKIRKTRRDKRRHAPSPASSLSSSNKANRSSSSPKKNKNIRSKQTSNTSSTQVNKILSDVVEDELLDLGDPMAILALAVQLDEAWGDESILQVPLETGRIHNRKIFARALIYLQKKTAPQSLPSLPNVRPPITASDNSTSKKGPTSDTTPFALTPIILSGFLALASTSEDDVRELQEQGEQQAPSSDTVTDDTAATHGPLHDIVMQGSRREPSRNNAGKPPRQQQQSNITSSIMASSKSNKFPNSTELVSSCNSMRRAALVRVKNLNRRRRLSKYLSPVLVVGCLVALYWWTMSSLQYVVLDLGYGESCQFPSDSVPPESTSAPYQRACRFAEADLWDRVYPAYFSYYYHQQYHALKIDQEEEEQKPRNPARSMSSKHNFVCSLEECSTATVVVEGQEVRPFYAMHTLLTETIIPLEQIMGYSSDRHRRRRGRHNHGRSSRHHPSNGKKSFLNSNRISQSSSRSSNVESAPLRWLGDTIVNALVREELDDHYKRSSSASATTAPTTVTLLDVGCGIGGTLYALLPPSPISNPSSTRTSTKETEKLVYRGISISGPEIRQARRLSALHQLQKGPANHDVQFVRQSYDAPLPRLLPGGSGGSSFSQDKLYMSMVAIESLSYSQNISKTLSNLASSLKRGGILIVVDDVVAPWASSGRRRIPRNDQDDDNDNVGEFLNRGGNGGSDGGTSRQRSQSQIDDLVQVSAKHSLLTHEEWTKVLKLHGFTVQSVRDLGLEFDLPYAQMVSRRRPTTGHSSSSSNSNWFQALEEWRRRPALFLLRKWRGWLEQNNDDNDDADAASTTTSTYGSHTGTTGESHDHASSSSSSQSVGDHPTIAKTKSTESESTESTTSVSLKIIQLLQDLIYVSWSSSLRDSAHEQADLSYYMYVCVKK